MPYQRIAIWRYKQAEYPTPLEWLDSQSANIVSHITDAAGRTPVQIYNEDFVSHQPVPGTTAGCISDTITFSSDKLTRTRTTVWESKSAFETFNGGSAQNNKTIFPQDLNMITPAVEYLRASYGNSYLTETEVIIQE